MNYLQLQRKHIWSLLKNIYSSIAKRGVRSTIAIIICLCQEMLNKKTKKPDDEVDKKDKVDTATVIRTGNLETKSKNWKYASAYKATHSSFSLSKLLSSFSIDLSEYYFIDLGSGKGRVILMASMLPFKEIIGVEFSESLNAITKKNLELFPKDVQLCREISIFLMDVTEYIFPDDKYILFMFNPFDKPVMVKVIENFTKQFINHPHNMIIIYLNPQFASLFDAINFLQKKDSSNEYVVYEVRPEFLK